MGLINWVHIAHVQEQEIGILVFETLSYDLITAALPACLNSFELQFLSAIK